MDERTAALLRKAWPQQVIFLLFMAALLFAPAGTPDYWQAWLFLAVFAVCTVATGIYFVKRDPALVERRMTVGPRAEQEPRQKLIVTLLMAAFLLLMVVPAFDRRWHWSATPAWRLIDEERVLRRDLPGYSEYCQRVRFRLVPGVW